MRSLRVVAVAILLTVGVVPQPTASAQSPAADTLAAANELFALMSADLMAQVGTQMTAQLWPLIERDLTERKIDDAAQRELRQEFESIQRDAVTDVMKEAPAIYAKYFTAAELRELAAFYRSPTGAKALRHMPAVAAESMAVVVPKLQDVQQKTEAAFLRVLRQRGYVK